MTTMFYIMDPMCSWCYAFSSVMKEVTAALPDDVELRYVMGGLAPDSDEPMPEATRQYVQSAWQAISDRTGIQFNFDFWQKCEPRRSTYLSCRGAIAAGLQGQANIPVMVEAIQKAYYQQARNPSDNQTLVEIAGEIGLDIDRFEVELTSPVVEQRLQADFSFKNSLGVQGFPTLALEKDNQYYGITIGYIEADVVLQRLRMLLIEGVEEETRNGSTTG